MNFSVIFDMDGVIVDTNPFHKKAWKSFCEKHNITVTDEDMQLKVFGRTGEEGLSNLFEGKLDRTVIETYIEEIDKNFRDYYTPFIQPIDGLVEFLEKLKDENIKCAVATSAPAANVELILNKTGLLKYFNVIVDKTQVTKGKPDPEIYLKTAGLINTIPQECIVIEDSLSGIEAALNAGMKVIAITTTHNRDELKHTDFVINNFNELDTGKLKKLFKKEHPI